MEDRKLRVAIVGLGKMGLVHAGILNVLPNVELVALCEKSNLIRKFSRKAFRGLETVDDLEKLAGMNLDAVYVTTPINSHFHVAKAILERISRNIFVEKTLAQSYTESKQLADLASQRSTNMVGYLRRFYVTFQKARELLQHGAIGKVESFKAYAYSSDFSDIREEAAVQSSRGGVLRDLGCHAIDLAVWFFGDLDVTSVGSKSDNQTEDSISFRAGHSEIFGNFDISWCKEDYRMPEVGFSIAGSKGSLFVNDDQVKLEQSNNELLKWYRHNLDDTVPFWLGLPEYYREDSHFVKSVVAGTKAQPDFCSAAEVDKIIDNVGGGEVEQA